ncbi:hypothetical protein [Peptacetobacter sp.]|uniref:hypothetical protein n=1 Tax=Peptacetobacter sp. TaxID=2991975 RepID=UPI002E7A2AAF|nr:hypothetical protein [Peptacetobacter sp.]MEE0450757.1 hypothetical protein [Peptacetobacter sp.]
MTKYNDFEIKIKKSKESENMPLDTMLDCFELSKVTVEFSIKYCDSTNGSCATGCQNSKQNCPGSTGRRK